MLITVGVLAYNESQTIARTLATLFQQSVFRAPTENHDWLVLIVPNGCKDDTASVAEAALTKEIAALPQARVRHQVVSLERPGKSNAWNEMVHRIAPAETEVFVMMDADIELGHPDTLRNTVRCLLDTPHARAVSDLPLKDFLRKPRLSPIERFSARASRVDPKAPLGISGQFYVARAETLRGVWMPVGLSVEDGYLAAMITTDFFRSSPDASRIVRAPDATHYFEGLTKIRDIVQHEVRIVIGTLLNAYLCWDMLLYMTEPDGPGAGARVKVLNESRPDWYARLMSNQIAIRGRRQVPWGMVFRRFERLGRKPWPQRLLQLPWAIAAFGFDLIVFRQANQKLRSGRAIGYW